MLNNIMKLDNIISNAVFKADLFKEEAQWEIIKKIVTEYCENNVIIISKNSKYDHYILYSFDPYVQSLELCKEVYNNLKYIRLLTSIYKKEFIIMNLFKPIIIIRSALVNRQFMINLHAESYPDFIYSIFKYKDLYNYKNCKTIYANDLSQDMDNDDIYDFCKDKGIIIKDKNNNVHNKFYRNILKEVYEFLSTTNNVIFLDNYGLERLKKDKIDYSDIINIIYGNTNEMSFWINNKLKEFMGNLDKKIKYEINIRQYNNMNFDDFRLYRNCITLKYVYEGSQKSIELLNIFNATSYDPIPIIILNERIFPHIFVFKRFALIMITTLLIYKPFNFRERINNILIAYKEYMHPKGEIKYIGTFRLESYDKKMYNDKKNIHAYIPYRDKELNNIDQD